MKCGVTTISVSRISISYPLNSLITSSHEFCFAFLFLLSFFLVFPSVHTSVRPPLPSLQPPQLTHTKKIIVANFMKSDPLILPQYDSEQGA